MDARLRNGIRLFNAGRFFESHEVLEELYLQTTEKQDKPFLEGIIQLSVAFRLFCNFGDVDGPVRMIRQALVRLENYSPRYLRIKVNDLIQALEVWTQKAQAGGHTNPLASMRIPKIRISRSFF
jgi:uncharacterized protein